MVNTKVLYLIKDLMSSRETTADYARERLSQALGGSFGSEFSQSEAIDCLNLYCDESLKVIRDYQKNSSWVQFESKNLFIFNFLRKLATIHKYLKKNHPLLLETTYLENFYKASLEKIIWALKFIDGKKREFKNIYGRDFFRLNSAIVFFEGVIPEIQEQLTALEAQEAQKAKETQEAKAADNQTEETRQNGDGEAEDTQTENADSTQGDIPVSLNHDLNTEEQALFIKLFSTNDSERDFVMGEIVRMNQHSGSKINARKIFQSVIQTYTKGILAYSDNDKKKEDAAYQQERKTQSIPNFFALTRYICNHFGDAFKASILQVIKFAKKNSSKIEACYTGEKRKVHSRMVKNMRKVQDNLNISDRDLTSWNYEIDTT